MPSNLTPTPRTAPSAFGSPSELGVEHLHLLLDINQSPKIPSMLGAKRTVQAFELFQAGLITQEAERLLVTEKGKLVIEHTVKSFDRHLELTS